MTRAPESAKKKKLYTSFIVLLILNFSFVATLLFYPYRPDRTFLSGEFIRRFYLENKQGWSTLVLGDSTVAYGVAPKFLSNSVSLAIPSASHFSVYLELKRYLAAFPKPQCVLVYTSYNDTNLLYGTFGLHASVGHFPRSFVWEALNAWEADSNEPNSKSISYKLRLHYILNLYFSFDVLKQYRLQTFFLPEFAKEHIVNREVTSIQRRAGHVRSAEIRPLVDPKRHGYLSKPFQAREIEDYFLNKILELANAYEIKLFYIGIPLYLDASSRPEHAAFQLEHWNHIESIVSNSKKGFFIKPNSLRELEIESNGYLDINHFNEKGAEKYSKWLASRIGLECSVESAGSQSAE